MKKQKFYILNLAGQRNYSPPFVHALSSSIGPDVGQLITLSVDLVDKFTKSKSKGLPVMILLPIVPVVIDYVFSVLAVVTVI